MTDWGLFIDQRQEMIVARIAEVLRIESLIVTDGNIDDVALRIANGLVDGIDETFVRREFQTSIAFKDFFVHLWRLPALRRFLTSLRAPFVVAFALDALNLSKESSEEGTHLSIVIDANKGFAFFVFTNSTQGLAVFCDLACSSTQ